MTIITVDGLNEEEFRRSIERKLRADKAGEAAERLRALLAPYVGPLGVLPERFLTATDSDLELIGWDALAQSVARRDRPGRLVTALSIAFGWPGEEVPQPDPRGMLAPHLEIGYYTDDAFPFSQSGRDDLLDGYSYHGCTWASDCEATDTALSLGGIDDLHGALAIIEARLLASDDPDEDEIRAGSLGACLLSVLLFQAVRARIERDGLPRPLCVMAGSNGVYPYFDAPVVGISDEVRKAAEAAEEEGSGAALGVPAPRYSSLLVTGIPRAKKRAVLVLEESEEEMAVRISNLRGLNHRDEIAATAAIPEAEPELPPPPPFDEAITPLPNGPLMTKKPSGHSWDFRDLLSTRDDELSEPPHGPAALLPQQDPEAPEPLIADLPPLDPVDTPLPPRPRFPSHAPVGPGFTLLEADLQQRLESLLAPHRAAEPEPEPVALIPDEPEIEADAEPSVPDLGPVWPLGIGWLEDAAPLSVVSAEPGQDEDEAPAGLLQKLRAWLTRRR